MVNRICLGNKDGNDIGLFISRAGRDVLTAAETELLFSSKFGILQVIQIGAVTFTGLNQAIGIALPYFEGFRPRIFTRSLTFFTDIVFNSNNQVTLISRPHSRVGFSPGQCSYAVLSPGFN